MSLEKPSARAIVQDAGMSARPEFYSGRGAVREDLNDKRLEDIHTRIQREYGADAVENFVQMVAGIPVLQATDFLLSLYRLEGHDWRWDKGLLGNENGIYVTSPTVAAGTLLSRLGGGDRDETWRIRNDFLRRHGIEPERKRLVTDGIHVWEEHDSCYTGYYDNKEK